MNKPTIVQYLTSACLLVIDEFNEKYSSQDREKIREIANKKYKELDIVTKIGYPFKDMVNYDVGDPSSLGFDKQRKIQCSRDMCIENKDFWIEVKYLKNWKCVNGTEKLSKNWSEFQKDFNWLFDEIQKGNKHKRAFIIAWFNCVNTFSQYMQLGKGTGLKPFLNTEKFAYFPFLRRTKTPTRITDIAYNYGMAYKELSLNLIGEKDLDCNCQFLGSPSDVFHIAIYY